MPPLLIGPCMFLAPLVVVLIPVLIVLWPPVLILTGIAWLLTKPFAGRDPASSTFRANKWLGESFRSLLTPWTYFDTPASRATAEASALSMDASDKSKGKEQIND